MYGGTISCPQCNQNLCPVCFPPTQHQPCCSSSSTSSEMILPGIIPFPSQCPLHFDTCAGKSSSKTRQSTTDSLNSAIQKCRREKVPPRSTSSRSGQGEGSGGGGGGGDDRRNLHKPLPEDAYINWMEDELARLIEQILDGASARFLSQMPSFPDGAMNTLNTNKWMNWLESVLTGYLISRCNNAHDRNVVNDLRNECVEGSRWLRIMDIVELMARTVRKVRSKNPVDSDPGYDPTW